MAEIVHWNILSTGTIAGKLAAGLAEPPDTEFVAVGFGERHGTRKRQAITTFTTRPRPSTPSLSLAPNVVCISLYLTTTCPTRLPGQEPSSPVQP